MLRFEVASLNRAPKISASMTGLPRAEVMCWAVLMHDVAPSCGFPPGKLRVILTFPETATYVWNAWAWVHGPRCICQAGFPAF